LNKRVYVDTSLLTAYYCPERDSALVQSYLSSGIDIAISRLTETEFASALSKNVRTRELASGDARRVLEVFDAHVGNGGSPNIDSMHSVRIRGIARSACD